MSSRARAAAVLVTTLAAMAIPVATAVAAPPSTTYVDFSNNVRVIAAGDPFCFPWSACSTAGCGPAPTSTERAP